MSRQNIVGDANGRRHATASIKSSDIQNIIQSAAMML